jgi:Na+-translocating ferredoxin:NAD+ oxidoreductase subunit G
VIRLKNNTDYSGGAQMKRILRFWFILAIVCSALSGSLAAVNTPTRSRITARSNNDLDANLKEVFPEAARFEPVMSGKEILYYKVFNDTGALLGAVFKASGKGYAGNVKSLVGMDKEGIIKAIKIISHNETPGLGARVSEESFTSQFNNKHIAEVASVQAISGASISSGAVINSVKKKAQEIKDLLR